MMTSQREVVDYVKRHGGIVFYKHQEAPGRGPKGIELPVPSFLRKLVGDDYFQTATTVVWRPGQLSDDDLEVLATLPTLRLLAVGFDPRMTRDGLLGFKSKLPACALAAFDSAASHTDAAAIDSSSARKLN
ncbi:MAG: hypothetical protein ACREHD_19730 [Pirellulales bacterium]